MSSVFVLMSLVVLPGATILVLIRIAAIVMTTGSLAVMKSVNWLCLWGLGTVR